MASKGRASVFFSFFCFSFCAMSLFNSFSAVASSELGDDDLRIPCYDYVPLSDDDHITASSELRDDEEFNKPNSTQACRDDQLYKSHKHTLFDAHHYHSPFAPNRFYYSKETRNKETITADEYESGQLWLFRQILHKKIASNLGKGRSLDSVHIAFIDNNGLKNSYTIDLTNIYCPTPEPFIAFFQSRKVREKNVSKFITAVSKQILNQLNQHVSTYTSVDFHYAANSSRSASNIRSPNEHSHSMPSLPSVYHAYDDY